MLFDRVYKYIFFNLLFMSIEINIKYVPIIFCFCLEGIYLEHEEHKRRSEEIDRLFDPSLGQNDHAEIYKLCCEAMSLNSMTNHSCCVCDTVWSKRELSYEPVTEALIKVFIS